MIKRTIALMLASCFVMSSNAYAVSEEEAEAMCRQYASEEQVAAHELDDYMTQCIADMLEEPADTAD